MISRNVKEEISKNVAIWELKAFNLIASENLQIISTKAR